MRASRGDERGEGRGEGALMSCMPNHIDGGRGILFRVEEVGVRVIPRSRLKASGTICNTGSLSLLPSTPASSSKGRER